MVQYKASISPQSCEQHLKGYGAGQPYYSAPAYNQYMLHGKGIGKIGKHLIPFLKTTVWPSVKETIAPIGKQFFTDLESGHPTKTALKRSLGDLKSAIKRKFIGRGGTAAAKKRRRKTTTSKGKGKAKKKTKKSKKKTSAVKRSKPKRSKTDFFADL
jgi:hypothetical protein